MNRGDSAEYENIASFSSMIGNDDVEVALYASTMCDRYGLDTISTGYAIAFAMELWEKGFISEKDTNGLKLEWGNRQAILSLLDQIAHRSSTFGDLLAEGVQSVSRKFPGSERFAMVIKGNPCNVGDYRATKGGAFAQAVATRGADHLRGSPVIEYMGVSPDESEKIFGHILGREKARSLVDYRAYFGKPSAVAWSENFMAVIDSAELCKCATIWASLDLMNPSDVAELIATCTGIDISVDQLVLTGERIYNVEKAFNVREGMRRKDDTLPVRWFDEPQPAGPSKGEKVDYFKFQEMLDEYYEFRGWDGEGIPTAKTLNRLGLSEIAKDLERMMQNKG